MSEEIYFIHPAPDAPLLDVSSESISDKQDGWWKDELQTCTPEDHEQFLRNLMTPD